ncbi:Os10g0177400 [Oryza sativa Japonica Group]|jgi:hypothetical protein|uniref:HVA22-like protein n=2 Tax=Oryza sativa subsp. japonica TaxID=39947 RepID=Q10A20_ORYSJ|nr:TB2/DP1, HVA22 family protein, expressed [Oryza sativa Japonica Group]KAB8112229.1 hypothetical protein EE612_050337 [Oryza sativa]BAF26159.1 Os10g0177400 [Oryza sativa Japonica Group]BAT10102.1 Os10g0177400 [Oryza sativa Japonica Group]|eukprot:NP_001064245.1 Os10g0177400 [Oryza sativa Japonica Group]
MMGDFLSRVLLLAFGYAYPAYECYKTVELNKPEIEKLIFWCQYWILVALLTVLERFGDFAISWLPLYSEAKLMFFIYLWCPRTKGTSYVYETFFRPYISQYENDIDCSILDLRVRAGDMLVVYWQKVAIIGQTTFFNILKYASAQSPAHSSRSRSTQVCKQNVLSSSLLNDNGTAFINQCLLNTPTFGSQFIFMHNLFCLLIPELQVSCYHSFVDKCHAVVLQTFCATTPTLC